MAKKCFFCDVKNFDDNQIIIENDFFISRYDNFPISLGHCEIFPKKHIVSFFDFNSEQLKSAFDLIKETKKILDEKFNPDAYNIGINEGETAGRTQNHVHIHLIPRFKGDVKNPRGGVRNIIPKKADYIPEAEKMESKKDYCKD